MISPSECKSIDEEQNIRVKMENMMVLRFNFKKYVSELDVQALHGVRLANFAHTTAKNDRLEANPHGNVACATADKVTGVHTHNVHHGDSCAAIGSSNRMLEVVRVQPTVGRFPNGETVHSRSQSPRPRASLVSSQ